MMIENIVGYTIPRFDDVMQNQKCAYKLYNSAVIVEPIGEIVGNKVDSLPTVAGTVAKELRSSVVVVKCQENM